MTEITLPWPPRALSPNARTHWRKKAPITRAYKQACWAICKEAGMVAPDSPRIALWLTFYPPDRRARDDDNIVASFKAGRDGLALALGIDDKRFVTHPFVHTDIGGFIKVRLSSFPGGNAMTTDGVTLAQAVEIQRLYRRDFLSVNQIAKMTGINLMMIAGVISGRYFPEALAQWGEQ